LRFIFFLPLFSARASPGDHSPAESREPTALVLEEEQDLCRKERRLVLKKIRSEIGLSSKMVIARKSYDSRNMARVISLNLRIKEA
jgi:hypothetical protein